MLSWNPNLVHVLILFSSVKDMWLDQYVQVCWYFIPCKFLKVNFLFEMSLMWFFCQDIQVYRYYRDLINFKTRGNPALMLRCINPNEAKILDAASGVHVKFRLAGVSLTQSSPKLSFYWDWGENSLVILNGGIMLAAFSSVHAGSGQPLILGFGY